jgi:hypothetical protein
MSVVAGLVHNGTVYLAADSIGCSDTRSTRRQDTKIFRKGEMVIGWVVSYRMGQILQYHLEIPEHPAGMDDHEYMATCFVEAVRRCLKEYGFTPRSADGSDQGGSFLVGYRSRLFHVMPDFQVGEDMNGYDACGAGCQYALGALAILHEDGITDPEAALKRAVRAAEWHSPWVRSPIQAEAVADQH